MQEQQSIAPINENEIEDTMRRSLATRIASSVKIGLVATLALALLEALVLLLLNILHVAVLPVLLAHIAVVLLLLLLELVVASLVVLFCARPLALALYLRRMREERRQQYELYTPLMTAENFRRTPDLNAQETPGLSQEQRVALLDLVQQQDRHQLILGVPGAGKTVLLRVYQYLASQQPLTLAFGQGRIPVFVPMKNYSLFLKNRLQTPTVNGINGDITSDGQPNLLHFLHASDQPALKYLRPYLLQLSQQGRLLLLCDGLNEIDSNYLSLVSEELVQWMRTTDNRLVMTCREVDYREQEDFVALVEAGSATRVVIYPLQPDEVSRFVERYVQKQNKHWRHTAGQIMQVIDRSRLRYHCTNPMMLFTLMGIIDKIGVERGKQIDTRGRLLRESALQLIAHEREQVKWSKEAPTEREVIRFLSEVACAARWANDRNAIQLRLSTAPGTHGDEARMARVGPNMAELADELQYWLDEHPAQGPFEGEDATSSEPYADLALLLQFALSAALIEISPGGVLSFRHELIAEYFVAEYFFAADARRRSLPLPMREELLKNVGRWSEPVAIWAGLLDDPLALAERFASLGTRNPAYVLPALALSLVCMGVLWTPPQAETQRTIVLPKHMEEALGQAVRNRAAREELARIFMRCAEEGGQEVYRSLIPLLMVPGVDELLALLDQNIVPELLFTVLQDVVDNDAYEMQVKRLTQVLGRFGQVVVARAAELSEPAPERSARLRAAAINILGGTYGQQAVEPLVARLRDTEPFIVNRAVMALFRLGPDLVLTQVLRELENLRHGPFTLRVHQASLAVLARFLDEPEGKRHVSPMQFQRILEGLLPVLTSNYQNEVDIQRLARETLARQGRKATGSDESPERDERGEQVIEALLLYLPSQNDLMVENVMLTLQEIGSAAVPRLLEQTKQSSELVRARAVEVLRAVRAVQALPRMLQLLGDASPTVQHQAARALQSYAPESVPGLIELVLAASSDALAARAAQILRTIGDPVVEDISAALSRIVPGRTRLLVQVLAGVRDPGAVPALITLLRAPERAKEPLLSIALVRALGQFQDSRVAQPLLSLLAESDPQVYEEAVNGLSQLGELALLPLIAALDVEQETSLVQRVRRAILGMDPFPGEPLVQALTGASDAQVLQLVNVFRLQGADAAQVLVKHMLHPDERVRRCVELALNDMQGAVVVPALLEALNQPGALRKAASAFLLRYPDAAISSLVELLGEHERGDIAASILLLFGPEVLRPLVSGLDDPRANARGHARTIITTLVRQSPEPQLVLRGIVRLFAPPLPPEARKTLLEVLTNELADVCLPALLEGLEDVDLVEDVATAFAYMAGKESQQKNVLDSLVQALHVEDRRRGAGITLVKIGGVSVVSVVGPLITAQDPAVARSARHILHDIGVDALPFIWAAHSDTSNRARREAAQEIFHSMETEVIKNELVKLLVSDQPDNIAMAITLLLERIRGETGKHYTEREMIPDLFTYIQTHSDEAVNTRIIALLLLLGEDAIVDYLLQSLEEDGQNHGQLSNMLLLMGQRTEEALLDLLNDPATQADVRAEVAAILGMMSGSDVVADYAKRLSEYGINTTRTSVLFPVQLAVSLRALGGMLAGGHWDSRVLQNLRDNSIEDSPEHELFNVLLGWRYEPRLRKALGELTDEREMRKQEVVSFSLRAAVDQKRIGDLEEKLEEVRHEHGMRGSELHRLERERDALRTDFDQTLQERDDYYDQLQRALRENQALRDRNAQLSWQLKNPTAP